MEIKISAVVVTYNKEEHIGRCLESVRVVADEIIVVDSYSSDRTGEICRSHGVVLIQHAFHGHREQKNWAINQATFPFVLSLEADEYLSPSLTESILKVKKEWRHDGYYFNRLTNYLGKWIYHTSLYPCRQLRLWDTRKGSWVGPNPESIVKLEKGASKIFLKGDLLHISYSNITEHVSRVDIDSTVAAQSYFQQNRRSNLVIITCSSIWQFLKNYILKLGFMEGYLGVLISINYAQTTFLKYIKLRELHLEFKQKQKHTICFFNSNPAWGGGEKWHFEYSSGLFQEGHPIIVYANKTGELERKVAKNGISSYGIKINNLSFLNPVKILRIVRILKKEHVKVIIMNLLADVKTAGLAAKIAGVQRVIYRWGSAIPIRNSRINRILFMKVVDEILAYSYETKRIILKNNPKLIDPLKIKVINNGMDFKLFESKTGKPYYQRKEGEIILGNAGRLEEQKAQEYLVDLAVELTKSKQNFRILIAGDGQLKNQLREYARTCGVEDRIVFLGFIEDMKSFMDSIDIFVLSSRWEGFGYVIVEAMASARPVIAFDVSINPEIIEEGRNGFLIPPFDTGLLSDRVMELIANRELRERFGASARASVHERFDYNRALEALEGYLEDDPLYERPFVN